MRGWDKDARAIEKLLVDTKVDKAPNLDHNYTLTIVKKANHVAFLEQ